MEEKTMDHNIKLSKDFLEIHSLEHSKSRILLHHQGLTFSKQLKLMKPKAKQNGVENRVKLSSAKSKL